MVESKSTPDMITNEHLSTNLRTYYHKRKTLTFGFILDCDAGNQIRPCTGSGAPAGNILMKLDRVLINGKCGVISLDMLKSLGQPTIRPRRYSWNKSKEGSLRGRKNKVEEIQLA